MNQQIRIIFQFNRMCQQLGTRLAVIDFPAEMAGLRNWAVEGMSAVEKVSGYLIIDNILNPYKNIKEARYFSIILVDSLFYNFRLITNRTLE